ncbi:MFS domain-containing protein [Caerostris darwini]|uniref:MFS domain-containing protein n=1 Tax=Caerostris darwini TaxID=1538125 RepID=A0AAV4VUE3_9ARAC|nr:MFS domain-containing protein [Caerostris darwini]
MGFCTYLPRSNQGWLAAAACGMVYFILYGILKIEGTLIMESKFLYGLDPDKVQKPASLNYFARYASGPLAGYLAQRLGFRPVIVFGCVLAALGIGSCFFASSIVLLSVFWGGLYGLGCGLATSLLPQIVNFHFGESSCSANGLAMAGVPISGYIVLPLVSDFIETYGLRGTCLIIGALSLHSLPAAIFLWNQEDYDTPSDEETMRNIRYRKQPEPEIGFSKYGICQIEMLYFEGNLLKVSVFPPCKRSSDFSLESDENPFKNVCTCHRKNEFPETKVCRNNLFPSPETLVREATAEDFTKSEELYNDDPCCASSDSESDDGIVPPLNNVDRQEKCFEGIRIAPAKRCKNTYVPLGEQIIGPIGNVPNEKEKNIDLVKDRVVKGGLKINNLSALKYSKNINIQIEERDKVDKAVTGSKMVVNLPKEENLAKNEPKLICGHKFVCLPKGMAIVKNPSFKPSRGFDGHNEKEQPMNNVKIINKNPSEINENTDLEKDFNTAKMNMRSYLDTLTDEHPDIEKLCTFHSSVCKKAKSRRSVKSSCMRAFQTFFGNIDAKYQGSCCDTFIMLFDPSFLIISSTRSICTLFMLMLPSTLTEYCRDSGYTVIESTYALLTLLCFDFLGKLSFGWIVDGRYLAKSTYAALGYYAMSASLAFMLWVKGYAMFLVCVAGMALCIGALSAVFPVLVFKYMEEKEQTMAMASSLILMIPFQWVACDFMNYYKDNDCFYYWYFYVVIVISLICGLLLMLLPAASRNKKK